MSAANNRKSRLGPNGRPVRCFEPPQTARGKLYFLRYTLARRSVQAGILLLFFGTVSWDWQLFGQPVLTGNLSSSELLGVLPMSDPFAVLQISLAGHRLEQTALIGAGVILMLWGFLSGRTWCAWACPINLVTDAAAWLRGKLGFRDLLHIRRNTRYIVLALSLVLSVVVGVAAFEWVSPISMLHRELIYGIGMGSAAVLGVFVLDLFILRHGWCGHLCPLGAFYALLGKVGQLRVDFDAPTCTHCGECIRVCPEPQVLNLNQAAKIGFIKSGECTNCARCIPVCPEDTLHFKLRIQSLQKNQ